MTTSAEVEQWLNTKYGVESELYKELSRLITIGVKEGWAADVEIAGPRYRRARLAAPYAETFFFSITAVLMDSTDNTQNNPEGSFRDDYHSHPYGEFNMVFRSMKVLRSQARAAGVMAAGLRRRREATTIRKPRAALPSRSSSCPQDGLRTTSSRRSIKPRRRTRMKSACRANG